MITYSILAIQSNRALILSSTRVKLDVVLIQDIRIGRSKETEYLGLKLVNGGDGILQFSENMKKVGGMVGMIKYAAKRSGCRFTIGREAWKSMIVSRLLYGVAAVAWSAAERRKLEA